MKRRQWIKRMSFISAIILCFSMVLSSFHKENKIYADQTLSNGTYTIKGFLKNASTDQASMGNAGIVQPMQLLVKDGSYTIRMECQALSTKLGTINFKGYLAQMGYFPDWEKESEPKDQLAQPIKVESYFEGVYDSYNDPKKGTDEEVKGKLYPHYLNLPVDYEKKQIWVQVYVPVMEAISKGNGLQLARLQLDWSSVKKVSDELPKIDPEDTSKAVDKGGLQYLILSANALLSHEDLYTSSTITKLKKKLKNAKSVYNNTEATSEQVKQQMKELSAAITGLKEKKANDQTTTTKKTETLDIKNLKDGTYSISGKILKTDKKTASMSDQAINHTIKLKVKSGKYYVTLDFKGLKINSQSGYLSNLKYYTSGYKTDSNQIPTGKVKAVTINSYQKDAEGKKIKDTYGSDYPDQVTFPLIQEALSDGYVPLQVYVPIMEAISSGSGKQSVYLKLDLNSIKSVTSENVFREESNTQNTTEKTTTSSGASFQVAPDEESKTTTSDDQTPLEANQMTAQETGTTSGNTMKVQAENEEETNGSAIVIPTITSVFLSIVGIFYKLKSRGL